MPAKKRGARKPAEDLDWIELQGFVRSLREIDWLLLVFAVFYLIVADEPAGGDGLYVATVLAFAALVLVTHYTPSFRGRRLTGVAFEILAMTAFITAVAAQTGLLASPLINLYLLPIVVSAVVMGRLQTVGLVMLVAFCCAVLAAAAPQSPALSAEGAARLVLVVVPMALVAILTLLLAENIRRSKERIRRLSDRDALTELYNMRAFRRSLEHLHRRAEVDGSPYAVLMIDVDNLKQINDRHGHENGNRAIVLAAEAIMRSIRGSDVAARYGGDEFVVLLPGSDGNAAEHVLRRIRNNVFNATFNAGKTLVRVSVSIGFAAYPADGATPDEVLARADSAMYLDKEHRRRAEAGKRPRSLGEADG